MYNNIIKAEHDRILMIAIFIKVMLQPLPIVCQHLLSTQFIIQSYATDTAVI